MQICTNTRHAREEREVTVSLHLYFRTVFLHITSIILIRILLRLAALERLLGVLGLDLHAADLGEPELHDLGPEVVLAAHLVEALELLADDAVLEDDDCWQHADRELRDEEGRFLGVEREPLAREVLLREDFQVLINDLAPEELAVVKVHHHPLRAAHFLEKLFLGDLTVLAMTRRVELPLECVPVAAVA